MMAKKLFFILALSLVTSGLLSFFYFNSLGIVMDHSVPDSASHNAAPVLDLQAIDAVVVGGTSFFFSRSLPVSFSTSTLLAFGIANVVIEKRATERSLKLRDLIINEIMVNPGIHLRELQRNVGCAMGALQYHLRNLENQGEITSIKLGNSKHFFVKDYSSDSREMQLVSLLRNPTINIIVRNVFTKGRVTQAELSRTLELDKSLVSYYAGNLVDSHILSIVKVFGRERPLELTDWARQTLTHLPQGF